MAMTVAQVREALKDLPDDTLVVMSKDAEGNSHSPLEDMWEGRYAAETTWYGDVYSTDDDDDDEWGGCPDNAVPAVVLVPVN